MLLFNTALLQSRGFLHFLLHLLSLGDYGKVNVNLHEVELSRADSIASCNICLDIDEEFASSPALNNLVVDNCDIPTCILSES